MRVHFYFAFLTWRGWIPSPIQISLAYGHSALVETADGPLGRSKSQLSSKLTDLGKIIQFPEPLFVIWGYKTYLARQGSTEMVFVKHLA